MNYYRRYIGDYSKKTKRLTMAAHGAYALMLDYCYAEEGPLPADLEDVYMICHAASDDDRRIVDKVLKLYFELGRDGYHNARVDEELGIALPAIDKQREAGVTTSRKRWGKDSSSDQKEGPDGPKVDRSTDSSSNSSTNSSSDSSTNSSAGSSTNPDSIAQGVALGYNHHPPTTIHQPSSTNPQPPASIPQPPTTPPLGVQREPAKFDRELKKPDTPVDKSARSKRDARATRLARSWALPKGWGEWAQIERPELTAVQIRGIADTFKDYWIGHGKRMVDWEATWRNWVRKERRLNGQSRQERLEEHNRRIAELPNPPDDEPLEHQKH